LAKYLGGDAASWWVMQANDDLKALLTLTDIEQQVPFGRSCRRSPSTACQRRWLY
jgi:hypothetical protein